jgi:plastocyanin
MRGKSRLILSVLGVSALALPFASSGVAGASDSGPKTASVDILGGDHFIHPGLLTNDFRFPSEPTRIVQGGTITFNNKTSDGHSIVLAAANTLPTTTDQIHNCVVCNTVNAAFFPTGNGPPAGFQLDAGKIADDESQGDADALDPVAPGGLTEDFDTPSTASVAGDGALIDTSDPNNGNGGPTRRTIVVTAAPGLYHYLCTFHPWMQGEIRVVAPGADEG